MPAEITLRPEQSCDEAFLRELYISTRQEEFAASALPAEMIASLLAMQFLAQRQGYRNAHPKADFLVILAGSQTAGRMVVDREAASILLVDIVLRPEFRGQGIGGALIQRLCAEASAAKIPLRLSVVRGQRAARLYGRLGFKKTGEADVRDLMEWRDV